MQYNMNMKLLQGPITVNYGVCDKPTFPTTSLTMVTLFAVAFTMTRSRRGVLGYSSTWVALLPEMRMYKSRRY